MSKHTDTTRSGDLVERLRDLAGKFEGQGGKHYTAELFGECADRIAALEADNARLMGLVEEAAAAERARIVAWLRKEADALAVEQADTRQGSPDWLCLREQVEDYQIIADAIERGEV